MISAQLALGSRVRAPRPLRPSTTTSLHRGFRTDAKLNVLVYTGPGTSKGPSDMALFTLRQLLGRRFDIVAVSAEMITHDPWEESAALLVIPGGRDVPYCEHLSPDGTLKIRRFVESGGRYLGLCAGAYFGASQIVFENNRPDYRVVGKRDLSFFPGTAIGSAFSNFVYNSEQGASAQHVRVLDKIAPVKDTKLYHNGGCYFDGKDVGPETTVLAEYAQTTFDGVRSAPAILECKVGHGKALLSGVHIEYNPYMAKLSSNPSLIHLVSHLKATNTARLRLFGYLLSRLGLPVIPEEELLSMTSSEVLTMPPSPSPLFLSSLSLDGTLLSKLSEASSAISNDTLQLEDVKNILFISRDIPSHLAANYYDTTPDWSSRDDSKLPLDLVLLSQSTQPRSDDPKFDFQAYFGYLEQYQSSSIGRDVIVANVTTSTQTILNSNPKLLAILPSGTVFTALCQLSGRGRGTKNWISPPVGCLQFSFILLHNDAASVVWVQYLLAVAICQALKTLPGYEWLPLHLKWPNDVYARVDTSEGQVLKKIGGILVNSSWAGGAFQLVVGCGLNVSNSEPTICINDLISRRNSQTSSNLPLLTLEQVLARILSKFDTLYTTLTTQQPQHSTVPFAPFLDSYYTNWLHSGQFVRLEDHDNVMTKIIGINEHGLLVTKRVLPSNSGHGWEETEQEYLLQPGGNSFDMMKGLISRKK